MTDDTEYARKFFQELDTPNRASAGANQCVKCPHCRADIEISIGITRATSTAMMTSPLVASPSTTSCSSLYTPMVNETYKRSKTHGMAYGVNIEQLQRQLARVDQLFAHQVNNTHRRWMSLTLNTYYRVAFNVIYRSVLNECTNPVFSQNNIAVIKKNSWDLL